MCKSEIFAEILEAVSRETEVSAAQILGNSKQMEVVDARSILVKLLSGKGFYPEQIAKLMHKTSACIRHSSLTMKAGNLQTKSLQYIRKTFVKTSQKVDLLPCLVCVLLSCGYY